MTRDVYDRWRCTQTDAGYRCPFAAYYDGKCYQHRKGAPDPDRAFPLHGHRCTGCNDPEPAGRPTVWRDLAPPPLARYGRVRNDR